MEWVAMQLAQKKTGVQFKALDQTLQMHNRETGAKQALSYRCQDMDRIIPSLMGVSKVRLGFDWAFGGSSGVVGFYGAFVKFLGNASKWVL